MKGAKTKTARATLEVGFRGSCGLLPRVQLGLIPGIGSLGGMPSRTRVLIRLLKLLPIGYGNAEISVRLRFVDKGRKNSLWSVL